MEILSLFGFNSLNGAINIKVSLHGGIISSSFNSLNGAINIGSKFR